MKIKFKLGKFTLFAGISSERETIGINSKIKDTDEHILLWDFDDIGLENIEKELKKVQKYFRLPRIYIIRSNHSGNYHAYCFKRCSFQRACYILASTESTDRLYFALGIYRGYWTLRIKQRIDNEFKLIKILESQYKEDVDPLQLETVCTYITKK